MKLLHIIVITFLAFAFSACSLEDIEPPITSGDNDNELPVEFSFVLPDEDISSRSISKPKTAFSEGDIIHIEGTFQALYNEQETTIIRYGALRKVKNGWDTVPGNKMKWPNMATTGTFKAYWISGSTGLLTTSEPVVASLSNLATDKDPLMAQSEKDISYGRGVRMQFEHLCSYLTIEQLEPLVSDAYWITSTGEPGAKVINNGFQLSLSSDNKLNFEFISIPDENYDNLVYIEGAATNEEIVSDGELKTFTYANFFLEPGTYDSFMIKYPGLAPLSYEFLKYDFNDIMPDAGGEGTDNVIPKLEAGNTYLLNVTKSPGITILAPPSAEGWDESDNYYNVNVRDFMESVNKGSDYFDENGIQILENTAYGVRLLHNVDFGYEEYTGLFEDFDANIREGLTFNGDYHYIRNIASPVFRYNYGTIENLGLKSIVATLVTDENSDSGHDLSRMGIVCQWNRNEAKIHNIRIPEGATITGLVNQAPGVDDETHNLGIVTGSNTGEINEIELGGTFNFTLSGYYTQESPDPMAVDVSVLFGSICGQNAGTLLNIGVPDNNLIINLYNKCQGNTGALYTGGLAGSSSGYMADIVLQQINIDCSDSKGLTLYTGGMAGSLSVSGETESLAGINNCFVGGEVRSGTAESIGSDVQSASYTGGLAGALLNISVLNSRLAMNVYGTSPSLENVLYATGGVFGRIRTISELSNIIAYGSVLTGVPFIGNFAGLVPTGMTWYDYAGMGIIVKQFEGIDNIGSDATFIAD